MKKNLRSNKKSALTVRVEHIRTLTSTELARAVGGATFTNTKGESDTCTVVSQKLDTCA